MQNCYVSLAGGIGNQLFQVAAGYAYARDHSKTLYLYTGSWSGGQGSHPNNYRNSIFKNFKFTQNIPDSFNDYHEPQFNYTKLPEAKGSIKLNGYFQSLQYFEGYSEEFKDLLKFKELDTEFLQEGAVGAHVRRGDYLNYPDIHLVCGTEYFLKNLEGYPQINIFSDSLERTQLEFSNLDCNYIKSNSELSDLYLLSQHENLVCSNSSFSWWASFLGVPKKKIIVPSVWLKNNPNHQDIYRKDFTISNF